MITIWKFEFKVADGPIEVAVPAGARILSWGCQKQNHICFWADVQDNVPTVNETFFVFGTGMDIGRRPARTRFLATVFDGPFVWHVFGEDS